MPERRERNFGGKAIAVNAGRERTAGLQYDVIGNLDADVSFEEDYFEFLMGKFSHEPEARSRRHGLSRRKSEL